MREPGGNMANCDPCNWPEGGYSMENHVFEGVLSCKERRWPVKVEFSPVRTTRLRFDHRFPSPCDPNDIRYHGWGTITCQEPGQALPTEGDLRVRGVLLLLERLPHHGRCRTSQWHVPIHAEIEPAAGCESIRFEFIQDGGIGHSFG